MIIMNRVSEMRINIRKLNAYAHQNGIQYCEQFTFWNANSDDEDEAARRIDEQQNNELNTSLAYHR